MLAFEDPASQAAALTVMPRRTESTITEPRAMQAALDSARQTGSAFDREEAYQGIACIASPIRSGGRAIGAVSVTGPVARMRAHSLVYEVRNTALAVRSGEVVPLPRPLLNAR
jgi:DNA-binding IclR family transcriptional regulator